MGRRPLVLVTLFAALLGLVLPGRGSAADGLTAVRAYDVPTRPGRRLAAVVPQEGFQLLGVHWRGSGAVEVRARRADGGWGPWTEMESADAPDPGSREAAALRGWHLGDPIWVGTSTRFAVRTRGSVARVRAFAVTSRVSRVPLRAVTAAGRPAIVLRTSWQADETLRRSDPEIAPSLRLAFVHHTAGPNAYSREEAPAVVRGILAYHVKANGWNDIGYNALVDRYGTIYEGRYGGIDKNVVGAHARGFNTGSFGIAVLGEFTSTAPPAAVLDGLTRMLAWRLDLAHVDPLASFDVVGAGNERFKAGVPVFLHAISGHRDTGLTACPGDRLYAQLGALAKRVATTGLPKIYDPVLAGKWGTSLTLTARLSSAAAWTATLARRDDPAQSVVVRGRGTTVSAAFDTASLAPGAYDWRLEAPGATPATGAVGAAPQVVPLALTGVAASPTVIAPDGDGVLDEAAVSYTLTAPATVSAVVVDELGAEVATVEAPRWRRAGARVLRVRGADLPDGVYGVVLSARAADGSEATQTVGITITRTLSAVSLDREVLSPDGDGRDERLTVRFTLGAPARARVRLFREGRWVTTALDQNLAPGAQTVVWDGSKPGGTTRDGAYTAVVEVTDPLGTARVDLPFLLDRAAPRVTVASTEPPLLRVDEPVTLTVVANGRRRRLAAPAAGLVRLRWVERIRTLRVVAVDRAGHVTRLRLP